jgi:CHAD domain-containing protein
MPSQTPALDDACEDAFRAIVTGCLAAFDTAYDEFNRTDRESGPHKARVALRRLTTAIDAFAPILRRKHARVLRDRVKHVFRKLGDVRDHDVFLRDHAEQGARRDLARENAALRDKVRATLRKSGAGQLSAQVAADVSAEGVLFRQSHAGRALRAMPVAECARTALEQAWATCMAHGESVGALPETALHDFRKDMKALRYLCEFFQTLYPGLAREPFDADFRAIQDALGDLNDHAMITARLRRRPGALLPPYPDDALARAEALWARLRRETPPWRDQPTR